MSSREAVLTKRERVSELVTAGPASDFCSLTADGALAPNGNAGEKMRGEGGGGRRRGETYGNLDTSLLEEHLKKVDSAEIYHI